MSRYPIRKEADGIPHTDEVDIIIPTGGTHIDVFSGHVPIALQSLTIIFGVCEPEERVLLWDVTHELIHEIARDEGWLYQNEYLVRDYDCVDGTGEELQQHEDSANRVFDRIWLLKSWIQDQGVKKYFEKCLHLAGDDEESIASVRKELIANELLTS